MKKRINPYEAYVIVVKEDGMYLNNSLGYVFEADDLIEIGNNFIKFAKKHRKDLENHNLKRKIEIKEEMEQCRALYNLKENNYKKACIYILECGGKYKIGLSNNVERRRKELDNKPFPVNIVYKSKMIDDSYETEQEIHKMYESKKIYGEWFDLDELDIKRIIDFVEAGYEIYD